MAAHADQVLVAEYHVSYSQGDFGPVADTFNEGI